MNQVYSTGHTPGAALDLLDAGDAVVASATADAEGSIVFRQVTAGPGYRVRDGAEISDPLVVLAPDQHPGDAFYSATTLQPGYQYIPTRDGTTLSASVYFPPNAGPGPWPTIFHYSGSVSYTHLTLPTNREV